MRQMKKRVIYSNYDIWDDYEKDARELLLERDVQDPTEQQIWDECSFLSEMEWSDTKDVIDSFFEDGTYILRGTSGRWDGAHEAGTIFTDFWDVYYKATESCDYVELYDENGHFYLQCSHHDGTNHYEIRRLTDKGKEYFENWKYGPLSDSRSEQYVQFEKNLKKYIVENGIDVTTSKTSCKGYIVDEATDHLTKRIRSILEDDTQIKIERSGISVSLSYNEYYTNIVVKRFKNISLDKRRQYYNDQSTLVSFAIYPDGSIMQKNGRSVYPLSIKQLYKNIVCRQILELFLDACCNSGVYFARDIRNDTKSTNALCTIVLNDLFKYHNRREYLAKYGADNYEQVNWNKVNIHKAYYILKSLRYVIPEDQNRLISYAYSDFIPTCFYGGRIKNQIAVFLCDVIYYRLCNDKALL